MVDPQLVNFIRQNLQAGYQAQAVRNHLITHGYPVQEVDTAFQQIYTPQRRVQNPGQGTAGPGINKNVLVIGALAILILIIGGVAWFMLSGEDTPEPPASLPLLSVEAISPVTIQSGDPFTFSVRFASGEESYPILLSYQLEQQGVPYADDTTSMTLGTIPKQATLQVPASINEGTYTLKITADRDGQTSTQSLTLRVDDGTPNPKPTPTPDPEPPLPDNESDNKTSDGNPDDNPLIDGGNNGDDEGTTPPPTPNPPPSTQQPLDDLEGIGTIDPIVNDDFASLSTYETLERIKVVAETDLSTALGYCQGITGVTVKDRCFTNVGEVVANPNVCTKVQMSDSKADCFLKVAQSANDASICGYIEGNADTCYIFFVTNRQDYTVCEQIQDNSLRGLCLNMRAVKGG